MDIQYSIYAAALQQPNYASSDKTVAASQAENESVSTRPVERVTQIEGNEPPILGGQLDVFV